MSRAGEVARAETSSAEVDTMSAPAGRLYGEGARGACTLVVTGAGAGVGAGVGATVGAGVGGGGGGDKTPRRGGGAARGVGWGFLLGGEKKGERGGCPPGGPGPQQTG